MSTTSPEQFGGLPPDASSATSPSLIRTLAEKRTTRDGRTPKRRGPKPDSRPAMTRRQELNRQAQRTHRERKEQYVRALEDEVLRLKEIYTHISQDKNKLLEENRQLKEMLAQSGLSFAPSTRSTSHPPSTGGPGSNFNPGFDGTFSPPGSQFTAPSTSSPDNQGNWHFNGGFQASELKQATHHGVPSNVDSEQAGIDFVLTLEKPCMDHLPWVLETVCADPDKPNGHALMASCPPCAFPELNSDIPFGEPDVPITSNQRTWELTGSSLTTLLDLSKKLELDGELTPVMAWGTIQAHPRFAELDAADFQLLTEVLGKKTRCYGFGAVIEEFEVRDAIESAVSRHDTAMAF